MTNQYQGPLDGFIVYSFASDPTTVVFTSTLKLHTITEQISNVHYIAIIMPDGHMSTTPTHCYPDDSPMGKAIGFAINAAYASMKQQPIVTLTCNMPTP